MAYSQYANSPTIFPRTNNNKHLRYFSKLSFSFKKGVRRVEYYLLDHIDSNHHAMYVPSLALHMAFGLGLNAI